MLGAPHIEAHYDLTDNAGGKLHCSGHVGVYLNGDDLAVFSGAGYGTGVVHTAGIAHNALHRTKQVDERRGVVGTHVQHGAAAGLVVKLGVGMPGLVTVAGHVGGSTDGSADVAVVDKLAAGLNAAAKEGVRGNADEKAFFAGKVKKLFRVFPVDAHGLFAVGILSGAESLNCDPVVLAGSGKVNDDLDLGVCKHLVHILVDNGYVPVCGGLGASFGDEVANALEIDDVLKGLGEVFEIDGADVSVADDANCYSFHDFSVLRLKSFLSWGDISSSWRCCGKQRGQACAGWQCHGPLSPTKSPGA